MNKYSFLLLICIFCTKIYAQNQITDTQREWINTFIPEKFLLNEAITYFYNEKGKLIKQNRYDEKLKLLGADNHIYGVAAPKPNLQEEAEGNSASYYYYNKDTLIQYAYFGETICSFMYDKNHNLISISSEIKRGKPNKSVNDYTYFRYNLISYDYNKDNQKTKELFYESVSIKDSLKLFAEHSYQYNNKKQLISSSIDFEKFKENITYFYNNLGLLSTEKMVLMQNEIKTEYTRTYTYNKARKVVKTEAIFIDNDKSALFDSSSTILEEEYIYNKQNKVILVNHFASKQKKIFKKEISNYNEKGQKNLDITLSFPENEKYRPKEIIMGTVSYPKN